MTTTRKPDPVKHCIACGIPLERKRINGRLEDRGVFLRRKACSQTCANTRKEVTKDAMHWRARQHRADSCQECGTTVALHVHHIDRTPANNDPSNLTTLCASCHLKLHWREDRDARMTAMSNGASMSQRSGDGSAS